MKTRLPQFPLALLAVTLALLTRATHAAVFNGAARVSAGDTKSAFSGGTNNGLTVSCWFKMAIPSTAPQPLPKDMVIMSNRQNSTAGGNFAFEIRININTGNVEFHARGASAMVTAQPLITKPFLERWYHVAITRSVDPFTGYLDGRQVFQTTQAIGAHTNSNGITIGGTSDSANLYGEVIETAIYQRAFTLTDLNSYMFADQPATDGDIRGYYKLRFSTTIAEQLKNFAAPPTGTPAGTDPLIASGAVAFELANQQGEQSMFDSHRNGGRDATAPLSGA